MKKQKKRYVKITNALLGKNIFVRYLVMRNKQDIAVLNFSSVSLREIHSVKLRAVKMIKHSVSRSFTELMVTCYLFGIP